VREGEQTYLRPRTSRTTSSKMTAPIAALMICAPENPAGRADAAIFAYR
jgi:hypothetical protein